MHFNKEMYIKIRILRIPFKSFAYYINKNCLLSYNTGFIEDVRERILIDIVNEIINFDILGRRLDNMDQNLVNIQLTDPTILFILLIIVECLPNAKCSRYIDEQHRLPPCSREASIFMERKTVNKHTGEYRR